MKKLWFAVFSKQKWRPAEYKISKNRNQIQLPIWKVGIYLVQLLDMFSELTKRKTMRTALKVSFWRLQFFEFNLKTNTIGVNKMRTLKNGKDIICARKLV